MNGIGRKALLVILALVVLCTGITGCVIRAGGHVDWPVLYVDEGNRGPLHNYYYYPDVDVYFDPGLSFYYWRDGGEWRHDRRLPRGIVLDNGHRRMFRSDARQPYALHDRVVQQYRSEGARNERRGTVEERRGAATERRGETTLQRGAREQRGAAQETRGGERRQEGEGMQR